MQNKVYICKQCNVPNGYIREGLGKALCTKEIDIYAVLCLIYQSLRYQNKICRWLSGQARAIVQIPYLSLYSTSCIRLINRLVWGIYRDLSTQDGKNLSVSCRNFSIMRCF